MTKEDQILFKMERLLDSQVEIRETLAYMRGAAEKTEHRLEVVEKKMEENTTALASIVPPPSKIKSTYVPVGLATFFMSLVMGLVEYFRGPN